MTLLEATIVVMVAAILVAAAAPATSRSLDTARLSRAQTDMTAIKTAITNFLTDTAFSGFTQTGESTGTTTETLVSDGDIPRTCTAVAGCGAGAISWNQVVNGTTTDFLERHLVTNIPGGSAANDYPVGTGAWRGAYLSAPVDPDPWGNRYAVNVKWLKDVSACTGNVTSNDTFVLSAGPDEEIDTRYRFDVDNTGTVTCTANTAGTGGAFPEDDDLIVVIKRDGASGGDIP